MVTQSTHENLVAVHRDYLTAGAQVVTAHTFGIDAQEMPLQSERHSACGWQVQHGRSAGHVPVLASLGPFAAITDDLMSDTAAADLVSEVAAVVIESGVDGIVLETLADPKVAVAALRGIRAIAHDCQWSPVFRPTPCDQATRHIYRIDARCGSNSLGVNCAHGPAALLSSVQALHAAQDSVGGMNRVCQSRSCQMPGSHVVVRMALNIPSHRRGLASAWLIFALRGGYSWWLLRCRASHIARLSRGGSGAACWQFGQRNHRDRRGDHCDTLETSCDNMPPLCPRDALWASDAGAMLFSLGLPGNIPVGDEHEIVSALPGIRLDA